MLIEILVFPGVDELDAFGPLEVLRCAAEMGAAFETRLVSFDGPGMIRGAHGLHFETDGEPDLNRRAALLVIPGGGWIKRAETGAWTEAQRPVIPAAIVDAYRSGAVLAAVCTGTMLIAAAGLLQGRAAVTHSGAVEELRRSGADVILARVVDDGDIITSGGVTSGIDLALYLVERFASRDLADRIASRLEHDRRGPIHIVSGRERKECNTPAQP